MALVVDENSYVDVDDADDYFEDHIDSTVWEAATADDQEKALVTATRILDRLPWSGTKTESDQDLKFPRTGLVYHDGTAVADDAVPTEILHAVYELAKHLLNKPTDSQKLGTVNNIKRVKAGVVEVEFLGQGVTLRIPQHVHDIVSIFLGSAGTYVESDYGEVAADDTNYLGSVDKYATFTSTDS